MANQVDLESVGMGAKPVTGKVGKTIRVTVIMANNGPDKIPTGEATCHLTAEKKYFDLPANIAFRHLDESLWKLKFRETQSNHELYFVSKAPLKKVGGKAQGFVISLKCKTVTPEGNDAAITLVSSLSLDAQSSDNNGENQSAQMYVKIVK